VESKSTPKFFLPALAVAVLVLAGFTIWSFQGSNPDAAKKPDAYFFIDGTWVNKHGYSVTINSKEHIYRGTALGQTFAQDYQLKGFHDNIIEFESNGKKFVAQFDSQDTMTLTKVSTGIPIIVTRLKTGGQ
jgi:hypothetical protein